MNTREQQVMGLWLDAHATARDIKDNPQRYVGYADTLEEIVHTLIQAHAAIENQHAAQSQLLLPLEARSYATH